MFLAILGHDLRNPLNSISLSAQVASAQTGGDTYATQAFNQIERSVEAIVRLVRDLLDFAGTGLGGRMPLVMGPVNLEALAREVVAELQAANPNRRSHIDARGDASCACDGARMRQVLSNLVGNSLQHGAEDTPVELRLLPGESDIILAVSNQGNPIPPDILPTIFDPLVRDISMDATRGRREGSIGLGLFIVHEIITSHGGSVDVSSDKSRTVFTIRMPRQLPEQ
ncbi:hypothetical protein PLANPX_2978 [Lacipirellula parvula]|uniref:histidine kinase n=2 Tax=Lacipirellula parvula TaxID=2650471 RepID=A0A5K7XGF5_9BACT|nr:hypothetical protein PLANPX_2978 [Lacipirellula parvula]